MPSSHTLAPVCHWFSLLASVLDPRSGPRLAWLFVGVILARGRRTVTSWIRAARLSEEFRPCYTTISAAGKRADSVAARLVHGVLKPLLARMGRLVFAIDDTVIARNAESAPKVRRKTSSARPLSLTDKAKHPGRDVTTTA
jgi:hypothetical protein